MASGSKESEIENHVGVNVKKRKIEVQGEATTVIAKQEGQLQHKDTRSRNMTVERLTKDGASWTNIFTDCNSDLNNTKAALEESTRRLKTAEANRDTFEASYEKLHSLINEAAKAREEVLSAQFNRKIDGLQHDLAVARERVPKLEGRRDDREDKLRQMEDLKTTNERQSKCIRDLERSKAQLQEYNNRLWNDMGNLRAELNDVPAELSKGNRTVADLQQQVQDLTEDRERDTTQILLLQNDIADKDSALEKMQEDEARLTNGLRYAKKELCKVKRGKTGVDSLLRGTSVDLLKAMRSKNEAEREASNLSEVKDELTDKLTESQGHLSKSNIRVSNLESQLQNSVTTIQDQAAELQNTRGDLKEKEGKLTQANVEITQLSSRVGALSGQLDTLQKSLTESRNDAASRSQELRILGEKFDITQRDLNHQTEQCSSQGRLLEQVSTLERQAQDRDALANFLLERPRNGPILRCLVEHDDKEVRLMIRIDQDAREVHCLVLYADHTCEVRRHRMTDCSVVIRNWEPYLTLGRTDPLVLLTDGDRWDWLSGKFEVE